MSMKTKLIVQLAILLSGLWLATATISRSVFVNEIEEISADGLENGAVRLMPLVTNILQTRQGHDHDGQHEEDDDHELKEDLHVLQSGLGGFLAFEARDLQGTLLLRSYDASEQNFPAQVTEGYSHVGPLYIYRLTNPRAGIILTVVEPDTHRREAINEATLAMFSPLMLLLPLLVAGILIVTRNMTRPIRDLRRQIAARGGANMTPIETANQPPELRPIAIAVDRLLDRLKTAMEAERAFAANAAHEMRTPLAGALAQAQRLRAELGKSPSAARVAEVEATLKRLSDFTEKLLQLSRVDAGLGAQETRENMSPVLKLVVDDLIRSGRHPAGVVIEDELQQDLMVAMDPDAFAICLRNLIENAALHGDNSGPVRVQIAKDWTLHVINPGAPVAAEKLAGLTERFRRGDTTSQGSGLGLSIVDRIMGQSGGSLALHSPAIGQPGGFEAVLMLP